MEDPVSGGFISLASCRLGTDAREGQGIRTERKWGAVAGCPDRKGRGLAESREKAASPTGLGPLRTGGADGCERPISPGPCSRKSASNPTQRLC